MERISSRDPRAPSVDESLDDAFADRLNGLTTLRMTLACLVLLSHAYVLGGRVHDPLGVRSVDAVNIADVALASFFTISGFFVTRSAMGSSTGRYLLRRALRILPGYWVCIILCAFAVAPLGWVLDKGTLVGFLAQPESPFSFVTKNGLLGLEQAGVAGVFSTTPYGEMHDRSILNGSLWTLPIEFGFYLVIGLLAAPTILRRAPLVVPLVGIAALVWFLALGRTTTAEDHSWYHFRIVGGWHNPLYTSKFLFAFMTGATLAAYARRIALRHWAGAVAAMIVCATLFVPSSSVVGGFWVTGEIALAYALLWIASRAPRWYRRLGWKNDYSYGIYLYAFPVQQLLAQVRLHTVSFWLYVLATVAIVVPLAVLSWHFVERPMMRLKEWDRTGGGQPGISERRWSFPPFRRVGPLP